MHPEVGVGLPVRVRVRVLGWVSVIGLRLGLVFWSGFGLQLGLRFG